jgi:hypothetical protein
MFTMPAVLRPEKVTPGGIDPPIVHDAGAPRAPCTVNSTWVIAVPAVALSGLLSELVLSVVAPAIECIAPREAATAAAERRTSPSGEEAANCSAVAATRTTGVRCKSAISSAPGRLSQPRRA